MNGARNIVENGRIETVHKGVERTQNSSGNADEMVGNYGWWENKVNELLY
jgi:hypothetical protein